MLATVYKAWLDKLIMDNQEHPPYTSSKGRFYYDIIANLIWVQKGLCAYTERRLQNHASFDFCNWKKGRYRKCEFAGELDHYDNTLKEKYGWLWNNLFLIDADVNVKSKRTNRPNGLLKPDLPNFNSFDLLEYDLSNHFFIPNRKQDFDTQILIKEDITYLGINFQPITDIRREYLSPFIERVRYEQQTFDEAYLELNQFFTAFEMSRSYMER